jgi:hypothetical protein
MVGDWRAAYAPHVRYDGGCVATRGTMDVLVSDPSSAVSLLVQLVPLLFLVAGFAVAVYVVVLAARLVKATERIAAALEQNGAAASPVDNAGASGPRT